MNVLTLLGRTVTIDTKALSEGLYQLHAEDPDKLAVLSFGMLDAELIELIDTKIDKKIKSEFSESANELFKDRISEFISDIQRTVSTGVYQLAKLVV